MPWRHFKNDNNSCQLNGSGNGVVFIETAKIRTRISGRWQFWKDQNKAEWTLSSSVGMNSVQSLVFVFFGDVRKVRCSVFETELDVRVKVRPNFSEH